MAIEAKFEGLDNLLAKFDAYGKELESLQSAMPQEFTKWQTEDMRRRYPETDTILTDNETTASTSIFPRGRFDTRRKRNQRAQGPKVYGALVRRRGPRGMHPILRPELFDKLVERMGRLMKSTLKWP